MLPSDQPGMTSLHVGGQRTRMGEQRTERGSRRMQVSNQNLPVERAAILGLGLMGGSLGMAVRAADLAQVVVGYDADPRVAARARQLGAIDVIAESPHEAAAHARLVVLAAPVMAMRALLEGIATALDEGALVTDLGSTKAEVVTWAEALLPPAALFVGGHPMTGRELAGIAAAEAGLDQRCVR